jgi:ABC-type transporter Mla subunit MlaD
MSDYATGREAPRGSTGTGNTSGGVEGAAKDAFQKASDLTQQAVDAAKQAASDTASTVTQQVKDLLNGQVGAGAQAVDQLARATKRAAEELQTSSPQFAGLVRALADRTETYADGLRDQSVDQLLKGATDFTRRQPALVFGMAAVAGFFAFRLLKTAPTPSMPSPSIQPSGDH